MTHRGNSAIGGSARLTLWAVCTWYVLAALSGPLAAQFAMPDPKQMAGIPRPVDDLPDGTVSVRVIRGEMTNNIVGQTVTLEGAGQPLTSQTDDGGRAEFKGVPAGTSVKASAEVDGEHLESQEFPFPGRGGIRLLLVATNKAAASMPAITGEVKLAGQSRIVIEPDDESVRVYFLLTILNSNSAPVNPPTPFAFEMPTGATGTTVLQGSSPQATVTGPRVVVTGPFAPGATSFEVACALPVTRGTLEISTQFPAPLEQLAVVVRKLGDTKLSSPLIAEQRDLTSEGENYIAAQGGAVAAGKPITLVLSGLPHHSSTPRIVALTLAVGIMLAGAWVATQKSPAQGQSRQAERKRLIARREKLFGELVRLEADARGGRVDDAAYVPRREQLMSSLEQVYGALDDTDASPGEAPAPA
jgi:hypothetical protein